MSFASDIYEKAQLNLQRQWENACNSQRSDTSSPTKFNYSGASSDTSISTLNLIPNERLIKIWNNLLHLPNTAIRANSSKLSLQQLQLKIKELKADLELDPHETEEKHEMENELEWLLLNQLTISIYTQLIQILLNSSKLSTSQLNYWNTLKFSNFHLIKYWVQTLPRRIYNLGVKTFQLVKNDPSILNLEYHNLLNTLKLELFSVPTKLPYFTKIGVYLPTTYFTSIRLEVNNKINKLDRVQYGLSCLLGGISELDLESCHHSNLSKDIVNSQSLVEFLANLEAWLDNYDRFETKNTLSSEEFSLDSIDGDDEWNLFKYKLNDIKSLNSTQLKLKTLEKMSTIIERGLKLSEVNLKALKSTSPPNTLERYYLPVILGYLIFSRSLSTYNVYKNDIFLWIDDATDTVKNFLVDWIIDPISQMYRTIRHREHRLKLTSQKSLESDLQSLERMVIKFAGENGNIEVNTKIAEMVKEGDLSPLLKRYEEEIQSPIKSAIFGNLIEALLIQVQKTKVDLALAMSALDKLLQSNELNFGMLAIMPTLFITYGTFNYLGNRWSSRQGSSKNQIKIQLHRELRSIHKILNNSLSNSNNVDKIHPKYKGKLLIHLNELRNLSGGLSIKGKLGLLEDIRELEANQFNIQQKLNIWQRCYNDQLYFFKN